MHLCSNLLNYFLNEITFNYRATFKIYIYFTMSDEEDEQGQKKGNALPLWGNVQTMNINNLVVTNILSSPYFKNELFKLKTFHEVVDEIYYKVSLYFPKKEHVDLGVMT